MSAFYLPRYVCPWLNTRKARLFGMGDEHVQCILRDDGWITQMKNAIVEEFRLTNTHIQRGTDTSDLWTPDGKWRGNFYTQYTEQPDGSLSYGADWIPNWFSVGQAFTRRPRVIRQWWDGRVIANYVDVTTIRFVKHHAKWRFPHPLALELEDVIELNWGGEEDYFYCADLGLGGWLNLRTGAGSFIGSLDGVFIPPPQPHPVPRPRVAMPPKEYPVNPTAPTIPAPTEGGVKGVVYELPTGVPFRNVRTQPNASATDVGDLRVDEVIIAYVDALQNDWCYIERLSDSLRGWVLWTGVRFAKEILPPQPEPAPATYPLTEAQYEALGDYITRAEQDLTAARKLLEGVKPSTGGGF